MTAFLVSQLPYLGPLLLTYLVGVIWSAMRLRRLGRPAALALAGCATLLVVSAAAPVAQAYVLSTMAAGGGPGPGAPFERTMMLVAVAHSIAYISGFALLLAAVFSGRSATQGAGFEVRVAVGDAADTR